MKKILVISHANGELNTISPILKDVIPDSAILFAPSGIEGLKKAKAETPEVVLLDLEMEGMDRYEVCKRLKSDGTTKHIPVLMMTDTLSDALSCVKGLEADADGFFQKPLDKSELAAQLNMALRINALEKEKTELKKKLQQAQKTEAIGTLAGGIAHEFNNILFPIIGYTEMCMYDVPENSKTHKNLSSVLKAADRAKELIQQIQNFCTKEEIGRKPLKVQYVIKESLKLLRASLPSTIHMRQDIDNTCGPVLADPSEVQQIIMNLCTHAYQALENKGGVLEVTLSGLNLDSDDLLCENGLSPGSYLKLGVIVKGPDLEHGEGNYIFDPLFCFSDRNDSIGMGLKIVYEIVQNYEGKIHVCPIPNEGTCVDIYWPLMEDHSDDLTKISDEMQMPLGDERLLLVDDEEDVLEVMHSMLEKLGYLVDSTLSGIEALERFRQKPENFDMVITDQTMPQMTGMELIRNMRLIRSDIPIILCTGLNEKIAQDHTEHLGIDALIVKPVRVAEIAGKIRDVLKGT